jgi:PAS domain S-box-containing protein
MADFRDNQPVSQEMYRVDHALLPSEELFRHAFGNAAIGMMLVNPEGKYMKVNQTFSEMIGYTEDELTCLHFKEITYPDDIEGELKLLKQMLVGELRTYQLEKRYVQKNGSLIWVILSISLVRDSQEMPLYFVSQVQDITDRKLAEQKLEESTLRYKSLLKHSPDIICMLDEKGRLTSVNPASVKITGYSKEELIGHSFLPYLQSEDWKKTWELFANSMLGEIHSGEVGLIHKHGHLIALELSFVPIITHDYVCGIYLIAKDITNRKQHEATIVRLHNKNKLILNAVSDGIFGIDEQLCTIFWNDAAKRLTGYTYEELSAKNAYRILTQNDGSDASFFLKGVYSPNSNEIFYKKTGEAFPVEYITNPIYEKGRITGAVITFKDITQRKKTEEMLRKSETLSVVGQIAAGVAHEIRNPLTALKGFTQLLQSGTSNKQEYYEIMLSELSRIELIITEMLVLAKPQSIRFQPKSLDMILRNVIALLETQAILNDIQFVMVIEQNLPLVLCEENQLKQMFINLIKNAIESMPQGGQIDIHMHGDEKGQIVVILKDQGVGMPPEVLERIGEPFYTTKDKGTGLGVMISSKIIEDHKGSMRIESNPEAGTIVSLLLPVIND